MRFTIDNLRAGIDLKKHYGLPVEPAVFVSDQGVSFIENIIDVDSLQDLIKMTEKLGEQIIVGSVKSDTRLPTLTIYDDFGEE